LYSYLALNKSDTFWKYHCQNKPNKDKFFSQEFKNLITCMLQLEPNHRPSMSEVQSHPWMQGPVPTSEEVVEEFQNR
jgi:serine/threonine protein kinase